MPVSPRLITSPYLLFPAPSLLLLYIWLPCISRAPFTAYSFSQRATAMSAVPKRSHASLLAHTLPFYFKLSRAASNTCILYGFLFLLHAHACLLRTPQAPGSCLFFWRVPLTFFSLLALLSHSACLLITMVYITYFFFLFSHHLFFGCLYFISSLLHHHNAPIGSAAPCVLRVRARGAGVARTWRRALCHMAAVHLLFP